MQSPIESAADARGRPPESASERHMHKHGTPTPRWVIAAWAALAALLLYLPHTANAQAPPEGFGTAYWQAAREYWGGAEPIACATIRVEWDAPTLNIPGAVAEATIPKQLGTPCVARFAPAWGYGVLDRCRIVAHEYGHLLGLQHSNDPSSVMYVGGPYQAADEPCETLTRYVTNNHTRRRPYAVG